MELVSFDFETHLISEEMIIPKPVCVSYCVESTQERGLIVGFEDVRVWLTTFLNNKDSIKIAHNATFELLVIYKWYPELRPLLWENLDIGLFFCTQLHQQLLDNVSERECKNHSLANLVNEYFKIDLTDDKKAPDAWRLRYAELEDVTLKDWPEKAKDYAIMDSVYTLDLYKVQIRKDTSIKQLEHLKASVSLNLMASRGILISKDRVAVLEREIDETLAPSYEYLIEQGFMIFNTKTGKYGKKVKILKEYITKHFKTIVKTKTGGVGTSGEAFDTYLIEDPDDEILLAFKYIGQYEKIKSAFISRLNTADPYIYTTYRPIVRSGRTSSRTTSIYPSVNIQQMPRGV